MEKITLSILLGNKEESSIYFEGTLAHHHTHIRHHIIKNGFIHIRV
jgi:hypothetical protein